MNINHLAMQFYSSIVLNAERHPVALEWEIETV